MNPYIGQRVMSKTLGLGTVVDKRNDGDYLVLFDKASRALHNASVWAPGKYKGNRCWIYASNDGSIHPASNEVL